MPLRFFVNFNTNSRRTEMLLKEFNEIERDFEDVEYRSFDNYYLKSRYGINLYFFKYGKRVVLEIPRLHILCEKTTICNNGIEREIVINLF